MTCTISDGLIKKQELAVSSDRKLRGLEPPPDPRLINRSRIPFAFAKYIKRTLAATHSPQPLVSSPQPIPAGQPLSLIAQYIARKLIQEYLQQGHCPFPAPIRIHNLYQVDISRLIQASYPALSESHQSELEMLVDVYQQLQVRSADSCSTLAMVKRRILEQIGLKMGLMDPKAIPTPVAEESLTHFCSYQGGKLFDAIRIDYRLYGLVQSVAPSHFLMLYQVAAILLKHDVPVILTSSAERYGLWVDLRSPAYSVLLNRDDLLQTLIRLHAWSSRQGEVNSVTPSQWLYSQLGA